MLIIKRNTPVLRMTEVFFSLPDQPNLPEAEDFDLIKYYHVPQPRRGALPLPTLHNDLRLGEPRIFANMGRHARAEIRKSEKRDSLIFSLITQPSCLQVSEFRDFYDAFAKAKSIPLCSAARLELLRHHDALVLSNTRDSDQNSLVWQAYIVDGDRAYCLYGAISPDLRFSSYSSDRALGGRVHRRHHWEDMKTFKQLGFRTYDWGGMSGGKNLKAYGGIDDFKRAFGGSEVTEYVFYEPRSLKGRLAAEVIQRLRV